MPELRKAVIPVAGFGTRFLPVTRAVPKMLLPVLDTPGLQFAVDEALESGIDHLVFVISEGQEAINTYFDRLTELEDTLQQQGKLDLLNRMIEIAETSRISYVYQHERRGIGHAILQARPLVGEEPFAVLFPDDLIWHESPTISSMIDIYTETNGIVVAVEEVANSLVSSKGIVSVSASDGRRYVIDEMVEKPTLEDAPSNLAIVGRYILTANIFDEIERTKPGVGEEIQITDAISGLLFRQQAYAYRFPGTHFDIGEPLGMLQASIFAALNRDDMSEELRAWMFNLGDDPRWRHHVGDE